MKRPDLLLKKTLIASLVLTLAGCAFFSEYGQLERDARQAYSRADYDSAVFFVAKSLQINQTYEKSQQLAVDAFMMANRTHETRIAELKDTPDPFKWDRIVNEYETLIRLHTTMKELPPIRHPKNGTLVTFQIIDFDKEYAKAKAKAAEAHYEAGLRFESLKGVDEQKKAAKEFKLAMKFQPDYKDAEERYRASRKAGIKRMAIFPFEDLSGKDQRYGAVADVVVDEIVTSIMRDPATTEFLELITRDQLDRVLAEQKLGLTGFLKEETAIEVGELLGVHEIITGKITQIIYSPARTVKRRFEESRKVIIRTEKIKTKDGKTETKNIYGIVKATVYHYTKTTSAAIKGSYRIIDAKTARLIRSESFEGKADFKHEWASYSGDDRALSYTSRKLVKRGEKIAPVADEMVSRAAKNLANSLTATLKIYAR